MVKLDAYEVYVYSEDGFDFFLVRVDGNTDPILTDIAGELINKHKVYFNGIIADYISLSVVNEEGTTSLKIKTRRCN